jgi:hypothetical protein
MDEGGAVIAGVAFGIYDDASAVEGTSGVKEGEDIGIRLETGPGRMLPEGNMAGEAEGTALQAEETTIIARQTIHAKCLFITRMPAPAFSIVLSWYNLNYIAAGHYRQCAVSENLAVQKVDLPRKLG